MKRRESNETRKEPSLLKQGIHFPKIDIPSTPNTDPKDFSLYTKTYSVVEGGERDRVYVSYCTDRGDFCIRSGSVELRRETTFTGELGPSRREETGRGGGLSCISEDI